jgi:phosphoribosylamine--glycine ligase
MNILIIGSGGREHAFAWKITQSPLCERLYVAPGNAGTASIATNVNLADDFNAISEFIVSQQIDLLVVGPEAPLVAGLVDYLRGRPQHQTLQIIGPDAAGARLEGSKDFSKQFMQRYGIPTAQYRTFHTENLNEGREYVTKHPLPVVLKADGLAAGKGVIIAENHEEATQVLDEMIAGAKFGKASSKVVVEQFLKGIELSVFVLTDGQHYQILPEAKDYKRIGEGDTGLNTGGMGAVSPVFFADAAFMNKVEERIVKPTLHGLKQEGIHYVGFIFIGLMNVNGEPYVIEYNVRMGDPETEVVLPRIQSDLLEVLSLTAQSKLNQVQLAIDPRIATTIMLVSGGYPGDYERGKEITGIENIPQEVIAFHAGTASGANTTVSSGGRVITLTALAPTLSEALALSGQAAENIQFEGKYYRRDIGFDLR